MSTPRQVLGAAGELRGNSYNRRARRLWLLATFGDGEQCPCTWCGVTLTYRTLEVDRWPICGHDGGRYTRDNIVPACAHCNRGRCANCSAERPPSRPDWWNREGREGITARTARTRGTRRPVFGAA